MIISSVDNLPFVLSLSKGSVPDRPWFDGSDFVETLDLWSELTTNGSVRGCQQSMTIRNSNSRKRPKVSVCNHRMED